MLADQGVMGITYDRYSAFHYQYQQRAVSEDEEMSMILMKWFGYTNIIQKLNEKQINVMKRLAKVWKSAGIDMLLFKGQANALYYPHLEHRSTGDIDCFLMGDFVQGNLVAEGVGADVDVSWYKHSPIKIEGEIFENHQYFVHTRDGKRGRRLNKQMKKLLEAHYFKTFPESDILLPPSMFNAFFLTYHGLTHFLAEGIHMKQVLEWAMFLKYEQNHIDWKLLYQLCDDFHFIRFIYVMTDIAVNNFGIKVKSHDIICKSLYTV